MPCPFSWCGHKNNHKMMFFSNKLNRTFLSINVTDFPAFGYIPGICAILPGKNPCRAAGGWILMLALGIPGCPK